MKKSKNKQKRKKEVKKKEFSNKKTIILISIVFVITLIILLFTLNSSKLIDCTKTTIHENILVETKKVSIKVKGNRIKSVKLSKIMQFEEVYKPYIDIVKDALEKEYKKYNLISTISRNDNMLIIDIESDEKYLLDNIDVSLSNESVSINIMPIYDLQSINLVDKELFGQIIEFINKNEYICK